MLRETELRAAGSLAKGGPRYLCRSGAASFWSVQVTCWEELLPWSWVHRQGRPPPVRCLRPQTDSAHPNSLHHLREYPLGGGGGGNKSHQTIRVRRHGLPSAGLSQRQSLWLLSGHQRPSCQQPLAQTCHQGWDPNFIRAWVGDQPT